MEKRLSIIYWYYFYSDFSFIEEDLYNIFKNKLPMMYIPSTEAKKDARWLYEFCREKIEWSKNA